MLITFSPHKIRSIVIEQVIEASRTVVINVTQVRDHLECLKCQLLIVMITRKSTLRTTLRLVKATKKTS
jgi:hypothetical protein